MNQNTENTTRELLKKSMLKVPNEDFSDRVMERLHLESKPKRTIISSLSAAWIFTILSILLIPFGPSVITKKIGSIIIPITDHLSLGPVNTSIFLSTFLAMAILFMIDNLVRLTFRSKGNLNGQ
jgi:hypothetical protein